MCPAEIEICQLHETYREAFSGTGTLAAAGLLRDVDEGFAREKLGGEQGVAAVLQPWD